jgi:hypothetical protein
VKRRERKERKEKRQQKSYTLCLCAIVARKLKIVFIRKKDHEWGIIPFVKLNK